MIRLSKMPANTANVMKVITKRLFIRVFRSLKMFSGASIMGSWNLRNFLRKTLFIK